MIAVAALPVAACGQTPAPVPDRAQLVAQCQALVAQARYQDGVACLQPFEKDAKPDRQTAAAVYQLGQLYEAGQGVAADPDHALRLYGMAKGLDGVAPDIAQQAAISATKLINRMRQAEEP